MYFKIAKIDKSSITSETLRYNESKTTILWADHFGHCNDWSFPPLQGSGGKFLRFYLVCTCSSGSLEPHDLFRR